MKLTIYWAIFLELKEQVFYKTEKLQYFLDISNLFFMAMMTFKKVITYGKLKSCPY